MNAASGLETYFREMRSALRLYVIGDEDPYKALCAKWRIPYPESKCVRDVAVRKAITGHLGFKNSERSAAKAWLLKRGFQSQDDGDV